MKHFLRKLVWFLSVPTILIILYVASFHYGGLDFYYNKVTGERYNSLILGNSKPAQGIIPNILNDNLSLDQENSFYNFAFAANYSPYGPLYYEKVMAKIEPSGREGLFIISVDPGSLSSNTIYPNDESLFEESQSFMGKISSVDKAINLDYILFRQEAYYKKVFRNLIRGSGKLHDDGWLEVKLNNDNANMLRRTKESLERYKKVEYRFSDKRFSYLKKLVAELKTRGRVFMIRMPMNKTLLDYQESVNPYFEDLLLEFSQFEKVPYRSYLNKSEKYSYTDGVHLTRESAVIFTSDLSNWIKSEMKPISP